MITPGLLLLDNYPKRKWMPPDNSLLEIAPKENCLSFRMICRLHSGLSDKWPQGKLSPQENCPKDKLNPIYFSPKNQKS